jgi:hypothetical protein
MPEETRATPDGIARADWDRVHQLALDIVNASSLDDAPVGARAKGELLALLDELQERYGPLPSILATRADYLDDPRQQEQQLLDAYRIAEGRHDERNLVWIASSLAAFYLEDLRNASEGRRWLDTLGAHLRACPDASESEEYDRLDALLLADRR